MSKLRKDAFLTEFTTAMYVNYAVQQAVQIDKAAAKAAGAMAATGGVVGRRNKAEYEEILKKHSD